MGNEFRSAAAAAARESEDDVDEVDHSNHIEFYIEPEGTISLAREASKEAEGPFWADDPDETQLAMFSAAFADDAKTVNVVGETTTFLRALILPDSGGWPRIKERLYDKSDPVQFDALQDLLERIFEVVGDRPTQRSSGSTSSRASGGPRSTAGSPRARSTRSRSVPAGSATSSTRGASRG